MVKEEKMCKKTRSKYLAGIWVADGCNLNCRYCFQEENRIKKKMSKEVISGTIKFLNHLKIDGVAFFGGEPLLNKPAIRRILNEADIPKSYITTNGTLIDKKFLNVLREHKTWMNLSLDGTKAHQDYWRDGSYDRLMKKKDDIISYMREVGGQVLMTCSTAENLYKNVLHIKELGFPSIYINQLDAYSTKVMYDIEKVGLFKEEYMKVLGLNGDGFEVSDFSRWKKFVSQGKKKGGHCGYNKFGLGISVDGKLFPCHRGPELPEKFAFGDVFNGFDRVKERFIRGMNTTSDKCNQCDLMFHQCPISAYHETGFVDANPHDAYCIYERAKVEVIKEKMESMRLIDLKEEDVKER